MLKARLVSEFGSERVVSTIDGYKVSSGRASLTIHGEQWFVEIRGIDVAEGCNVESEIDDAIHALRSAGADGWDGMTSEEKAKELDWPYWPEPGYENLEEVADFYDREADLERDLEVAGRDDARAGRELREGEDRPAYCNAYHEARARMGYEARARMGRQSGRRQTGESE